MKIPLFALALVFLPVCGMAQDAPLHHAVGRAAAAGALERRDGDDVRGDWSRVVRLDSGARITLTYSDGRAEDRIFVGGTDAKLIVRGLAGSKRSELIAREAIREVVVERSRRPLAAAVFGAAAGALVGLLTASSEPRAQCAATCNDQRVMSSAGGAALGFALGYGAARPHPVRELLYRAATP